MGGYHECELASLVLDGFANSSNKAVCEVRHMLVLPTGWPVNSVLLDRPRGALIKLRILGAFQ